MPVLDVPAAPAPSNGETSPQTSTASRSAAVDDDPSNAIRVAAATASDVGRSSASAPDKAEIDYARATAAGIFRRRTSQRSAAFVSVDGPGYGLCLRAPGRSGKGYDHALIVFARRLNGSPISQVDDDTIVYRRAGDAAPCRGGGIDWVRLVG